MFSKMMLSTRFYLAKLDDPVPVEVYPDIFSSRMTCLRPVSLADTASLTLSSGYRAWRRPSSDSVSSSALPLLSPEFVFLLRVFAAKLREIGCLAAPMVGCRLNVLRQLVDREFFRWHRFDVDAAHFRRAADFKMKTGPSGPLSSAYPRISYSGSLAYCRSVSGSRLR